MDIVNFAVDDLLRVGDFLVKVAFTVEALRRAIQKKRLVLRGHPAPAGLGDFGLAIFLLNIV